MDLGLFEQVALVLAVCVAAGVLALLLRQQLIVGLIVAGIVVGPGVTGLVVAGEEVELLAELGIALLLFVVGLKLDVRIVRRLGPVALAAGIGQIVLTFSLTWVVLLPFGLDANSIAYLAMAMTFSSTIIVIKLLTDLRTLDRLDGRLALGILIVQDLMVVLAMIAITASGDLGEGSVATQLAVVVARGLVLLAATVIVSRLVTTRALDVVARSPELLVLTAIAWAVSLGAGSVLLGFSAEVGAFLAGVALAATPYREAISGRLVTLRDFLLVFFFIQLGADVELDRIGSRLGVLAVLTLVVLIGKPLIVTAVLALLRYPLTTSLRAGVTLGQVSEFSLILAALGVSSGQIGGEVAAIVTGVALLTIAISTQTIQRSDRLVARTAPLLHALERRSLRRGTDADDEATEPDHVVVGLGRLGSTLAEELVARGDRVLGVDFDPRNRVTERLGLPVVFGDAEDPTLVERLPLERVRWVISTVRDRDVSLALLSALREAGFRGRVAVAAEDPADCERLRAAGAAVTIQPLHVAAGPFIAAIHAAD
ncbi:MAG: hypothetical protein RLZZ272_1163 [Actinomycetota bacterium]